MAKKNQPLGIFAKTEPTEDQTSWDVEKPVKKSSGVALYETEWLELENIGHYVGMNRHQVAAYALRDFLRRWRTGEIKTETQTETRRKLPGT